MTDKKDEDGNQPDFGVFTDEQFEETMKEMMEAYQVINRAITELVFESDLSDHLIMVACFYNAVDMAAALMTKMNRMSKEEATEEMMMLLATCENRAEDVLEGREDTIYNHIYDKVRELVERNENNGPSNTDLH